MFVEPLLERTVSEPSCVSLGGFRNIWHWSRRTTSATWLESSLSRRNFALPVLLLLGACTTLQDSITYSTKEFALMDLVMFLGMAAIPAFIPSHSLWRDACISLCCSGSFAAGVIALENKSTSDSDGDVILALTSTNFLSFFIGTHSIFIGIGNLGNYMMLTLFTSYEVRALVWSVSMIFVFGMAVIDGLCAHSAITRETSLQAIQKLLAGTCDAVACLDNHMRFQNSSAQLQHVLHTYGTAHGALEGKSFLKFLANEVERERFSKFISSSANTGSSQKKGGLPQAIQIDIVADVGVKRGDLLHVSTNELDGSVTHYIGLSENFETACAAGLVDAPTETSKGVLDIAGSSVAATNVHRYSPAVPGERAHERGATQRALKSSSGSSSSCSSSATSAKSQPALKQKLTGLDHIAVRLNFDMQIEQCSLHVADHQSPGTHLSDFLDNSCAEPFVRWLAEAGNRLLCGEPAPKYDSHVIFRLPHTVCSHAHVRLIAEAIELELDEDLQSADDNCFPSLNLTLGEVAAILSSRRVGHKGIKRDNHKLAVVPEGKGKEGTDIP